MRNVSVRRGYLGYLGVLAGALLMACTLSAGTVSYNSWSYETCSAGTCSGNNFSFGQLDATNDPHEFNLDEHYMYSWRIDGVNMTGQTISSVSLTFNNIANWDSNPNELFIHLLDSATNPGITRFQWDSNLNASPVPPPFTDHWNSPYPTTANGIPYNLVGAGVNNLLPNSSVANTVLNDGTYTYTPNAGGPSLPTNFSLTNIDFKVIGASSAGGQFVYNFSAADITALTNYIAAGNSIALGFNPDCHFYNNGITLSINYSATGGGGSVPEPATLSLLGLGLLGVARKLRRA